MVLYEFCFQLHLSDLLKLFTFALPTCLVLFSYSLEVKHWRYIVRAFAIIVFVFELVTLFIMPIYAYHNVCKRLNDGNVYIIEGEVTDFQESPSSAFLGHSYESFKVGEVEFSYSGDANYGYSKYKCDGGVIKGNGQRIRITYCNDIFNDVIICRIEDLEKNEDSSYDATGDG